MALFRSFRALVIRPLRALERVFLKILMKALHGIFQISGALKAQDSLNKALNGLIEALKEFIQVHFSCGGRICAVTISAPQVHRMNP